MQWNKILVLLLCTLAVSGCGVTVKLPAHTELIVSSQSGTHAIDINTGKQIWMSRLGAGNNPAVVADQVFVSYTANDWAP